MRQSSFRVLGVIAFFAFQSISALAEESVAYFSFSNLSRIAVRIQDDGKYAVYRTKNVGLDSREETPLYIGTAKLKKFVATRVPKTGEPKAPEGIEFLPARVGKEERNFTYFEDEDSTYLVFDQGTVYKMPWGFKDISAQLIERGSKKFVLASTKGHTKDSTDILEANLISSYFTLEHTYRPDMHKQPFTISNGILQIEGVSSLVRLDPFTTIPSLTYKDNQFQFHFTADRGTALVRMRDGASLVVSPTELKLEASDYSVKDGVLTLVGDPLRIDLGMFDAEIARRKFLDDSYRVLDVEGKKVDHVKVVLDQFPDLVEESLKYPLRFTERMDEKILRTIGLHVRHRRSVALLGGAGSGKTSAVRAFAREVGLGNVPGIPRSTRIIMVRPSNLAANTTNVGAVEGRMEAIIATARRTGWLVFFDEAHSLAGVGTHSRMANDVTQNMKGPMEEGTLVLLATDTLPEFNNAFLADAPLYQRFQQIAVATPTRDVVLEIAKGRVESEGYTAPSTEVLNAAIDLSSEFDVVAEQPRSVVYLLKEAYARMEENGHAKEPVTIDMLKLTAAEKYRFDHAHFDREFTRKKIRSLREKLDEVIIGQEAAKRAIVSMWEMALTGVKDPNKVNSVLLLGASGIGKTRIAEAAADLMGYQKTVIGMNKYTHMEQESFRKDVYEALGRNPFQVIVLDEFDKCPVKVQEAALEILGEGKFSMTEKRIDGTRMTRTVYAKHALFVLTANAGANYIEKHVTDMTPIKQVKENISGDELSPFVLNRVSLIVPMRTPTQKEFDKAVRTFVARTLKVQEERFGVKFALKDSEGVLEKMIETYKRGTSDFRDVNDMTMQIMQHIAHAIIETPINEGSGETVVLDFSLKETRREPNPSQFYIS